jgi:hypothetical protein
VKRDCPYPREEDEIVVPSESEAGLVAREESQDNASSSHEPEDNNRDNDIDLHGLLQVQSGRRLHARHDYDSVAFNEETRTSVIEK